MPPGLPQASVSLRGTEDGGQSYTGGSRPLGTPLVEAPAQERPGCRGLDMSEKGDTEWNLFMDARAWRSVYGTWDAQPADPFI